MELLYITIHVMGDLTWAGTVIYSEKLQLLMLCGIYMRGSDEASQMRGP